MSDINQSTINENYEAWKKIRGDWGVISPVTKVIGNNKKESQKHWKKEDIEEKNGYTD